MVDINKAGLAIVHPLGGVPFGNLSVLMYAITLVNGILVGSSKATAVATDDVVNIGILPKGMLLLDMLMYADGGFTDTTTATVGFRYVDGVDDTDVPQDLDYFVAGSVLTNAAIVRKTNVVPPVRLPKKAYLTFTNGIANQAATGTATILIIGICNMPA